MRESREIMSDSIYKVETRKRGGMNNNPYPTIIANIRFAKDTDKFLVKRNFTDWEVARSFCETVIGDYSEDYGIVEFILLTDYATMNSQEYSLESNESLGERL